MVCDCAIITRPQSQPVDDYCIWAVFLAVTLSQFTLHKDQNMRILGEGIMPAVPCTVFSSLFYQHLLLVLSIAVFSYFLW